jgi:hypothetical protein
MAHTVPPMPEKTPPPSREVRAKTEADDRLDKAMRPTDYHTAVEIDADAKAAAAAAQADVTETNLQIHARRVPNTGEESVVAPPPLPGAPGEVLSSIGRPVTLQLEVGMVLTDADPASAKQRALAPPGLTGLTSVETMPPSMIPSMPSRLSAELNAQTDLSSNDPFAGDSAVQGGITSEMAAPRMTGEMASAEPLTDQLARQQHDSSDADQQGPHGTDRTRSPDESLVGPSGTDVTRRPAQRASQAPIATHPPRAAEHTPIPTNARPPSMSTAPTNLAPPKAEEALASGPTPGCPQCEAPMAWVEEHLRFYCKQCRMYF